MPVEALPARQSRWRWQGRRKWWLVVGGVCLAAGLGFFLFSITARPAPRFEVWEAGGRNPHADLVYTFAPHSRWKFFYAENARGYFRREDPHQFSRRREWRLTTAGPSIANLELPADINSADYRVTVAEASPDAPWRATLYRAIRLDQPGTLELSFRWRATSTRSLEVLLLDEADGWRRLGPGVTLTAGTEWSDQRVELVVDQPRSSAAVVFNLAGAAGIIEWDEIRVSYQGRYFPADASRMRVPPGPFYIEYTTNSGGIRDREYTREKPAGVFRIACLGSSSLFGDGIHQSDVVTEVLETRLNQGLSTPRYEVLNCGMPGHATYDLAASYQALAAPYDPDLVLIFITPHFNLSIKDGAKASQAISEGNWLDRLRGGWVMFRSTFAGVDLLEPALEFARSLPAAGKRAAAVFFVHRDDYSYRQVLRSIEREWQADVPHLNVAPYLLARAQGETLDVIPDYDIHPNELAHYWTAEVLTDFLREEALVPPLAELARGQSAEPPGSAPAADRPVEGPGSP